MNIETADALQDLKEKQNNLAEIINAEKKLWALINSKGLLNNGVQDLFGNVRTRYENIFLNNCPSLELPDVEYSLWKLHYKHIDEFRKRMRQASSNSEFTRSGTPQDVASLQRSIDSHTDGLKSFLSEAIGFYQNLITKLRRCYGLHGEPFWYKKGDGALPAEPAKLDQCQYLCHRFLVCLGDLARYIELHRKHDMKNWSVATTYYLKAAMAWPDGGNPQNQLALLATYIGDDFLALYHSVRSLAVKEPFPDAWNNLMLLFEKNRSCNLHSLSREALFDFSEPSKRSSQWNKSLSNDEFSNGNGMEATEHVSSAKTELWPLFVRMISFFFIKFSLEDFTYTFASTMKELEKIMVSLDDTTLKELLEAYGDMDASRRGPYRSLQLVSILIFTVHSLAESTYPKEPIVTVDIQHTALIRWALTSTFIFMGRCVDRCLKWKSLEDCPLLPSVLVFVEWLVGILDKAEMYVTDEKVAGAISYFFGAFAELLNRLDSGKDETRLSQQFALWEDYELQGFAPIAHVHESLNFTTQCDRMSNFDSGSPIRIRRLFHFGMEIVNKSQVSKPWIFYDEEGRKFSAEEPVSFQFQKEEDVAKSNPCVDEAPELNHGSKEEAKKDVVGKNQSHNRVKPESVAVEEDEVILFKPITRHNSAPLDTSITNNRLASEGKRDQTIPPDECLRRAASLFIAQTQGPDLGNLQQDTFSFRVNKPFKPQEPLLKDSATYPAGPPSLSAWVLDREISNIEREKETRNFSKQMLSPIMEIDSASLSGLSLGEVDHVIGPVHPNGGAGSAHGSVTSSFPSSPYLSPVPSAPLLPDDAVWFREKSLNFPECMSSVGVKEPDGILGAAPLTGYSNWSVTRPPFDSGPCFPGHIDPYPPPMSSSEWLHHYRNSQNLERSNNHTRPVPFIPPGNLLGNLYSHDPSSSSRFDLSDRWGNPSVSSRTAYLESPQLLLPGYSPGYVQDEQRKEKSHPGYQRPSPYGCGAGTDLRTEQPPILNYLEEREWQLQREQTLRGPTYMRN